MSAGFMGIAGREKGAAMSSRMMVLGNGPSLRGVDLKRAGSSSIGMNAAYRAWDKIGWTPSHYICLDHQLIISHADYILESVQLNRFEGLFLAAAVLDVHPEIAENDRVIFVDQYVEYWYNQYGKKYGLERRHERFFESSNSSLLTTGSYAIRWAAAMGYDDIGLIGIDCKYVELPEWKKLGDTKIGLEMATTPKSNPNYFFDDYQQKGDLFNVPNPEEHGFNLHLEAVRQADLDVRQIDPTIGIANLAPNSELNFQSILPYRPVSDYLDLPIGSVLIPMIPRELDAAIRNLRIWNEPDAIPSRRPNALKPVLVFCMNCGYDAVIEKTIIDAYQANRMVIECFSRMVVHFLDLPPEKDQYIRDAKGPVPEFGYKSGPNWMFYEAMRYAKQYGGYCLQIETDCKPIQPGWLDTLTDLARRSPDKLIVGSPYRGQGTVWRGFARHINGNALYNVGEEIFWEWLDGILWPWLCETVKAAMPTLAYDCAWEAYIHREDLDSESHPDWFKVRKYVDKFAASSHLLNIAGAAELRGELTWTLRAIKQDFPDAVVVHGPYTSIDEDEETPPLNIATLAVNGACQRLSRDSGRITGLSASNDFLMFVFGRFRFEFREGDVIRLSVDVEKNGPARLQFALSRHGTSRYEASFAHVEAAAQSLHIEMTHTVISPIAKFRLQIGSVSNDLKDAITDITLSNLQISVERDDKVVAAGTSLVPEDPSHWAAKIVGDGKNIRVLLIDATLVGGGTATGELKSKFFKHFTDSIFLHAYWDYGANSVGLGVLKHEAGALNFAPVDVSGSRDALIAAFNPEVILYRPVEGKRELAELADSLIANAPERSIVWVMDDLMGRRDESEEQEEVAALLESSIKRSAVRWAISSSMAVEFERRYNVPFGILRNGTIINSEAPLTYAADLSWHLPIIMRYSGGLAADMNSEVVLEIAKAVEGLGGMVHFEIATQPHWFAAQAERYAGLRFTTIESIKRNESEYLEWIGSADLLVMGYNFDDTTLSYIRYSFANKYPELLATGRQLFVYGPREAETVNQAVEDGLAYVVDRPHDTAGLSAKIVTAVRRLPSWSPKFQIEQAALTYSFADQLGTFLAGIEQTRRAKSE
jgi:hypothetical protein